MMKKTDFLLILFYKLMLGEHVKKRWFIEEYSIGKRTFDRYIGLLRMTLSEIYSPYRLCYDAAENSYYLKGINKAKLRGMELLPVLYLLFGSHALVRKDIAEVLYPLLSLLPSTEKEGFYQLTRQLGKDYEVSEGAMPILKILWDLHCVIKEQHWILLHYEGHRNVVDSIPVLPKQLMYQNGKFLLMASLRDAGLSFFPLQQIRSFSILRD